MNCSLTPEEFRRIKKAAKTKGKTPTAYLREACLAYMDCRCLVSENLEVEFSGFVFLMRNMANNLNQIAKWANTFQRLRVVDIVAMRGTIFEVERLVKEFVKNPVTMGDDC